MKSDKTLTAFCEEEVPSYAAYDNLRKIASYIDGLKLSQRKVIYTMLKKFPSASDEIKTARLASSVAEETEYLHGEGSLCTVLETMAASFVGSNNYPLIKGSGNFGSRFAGAGSAAAPRYTYCSVSPLVNALIPEVSRKLCPSQTFEGSKIEPEFYVPIFPVVFLNGTDGLSSGWKTTIYPRDPKEIMSYIEAVLQAKAEGKEEVSDRRKKSIEKSLPWFKGFTGVTKIEEDDGEEVFVNYGKIEKKHTTLLEITEVPITYSYSSYIKFLDRLEEKEPLFTGYDDNCDPKTDTFNFKIHVKRDFWTSYPDEESWLKLFGLQKNLNEQLNCVGPGGKVKEFTNIREILDEYIKVRLKYYGEQKKVLIDEYTEALKTDVSKYVFVSGVIDGKIVIGNRKTGDIEADLDKQEKIRRMDGTYNYLLALPMRSMTKETLDKLKTEIFALREKITELKAATSEGLWLSDLKDLKKLLD